MTLDLVLKVTLAITILAWASLVGQVLLKISAREILVSYLQPVSLLAVGITFLSALLRLKQDRLRTPRVLENPPGIIPGSSLVKPSTHLLVLGGKEGPSVSQPKSARASRFRSSKPSSSLDYRSLDDNRNERRSKNPEAPVTVDLHELGRAFVPPVRLVARIAAFSFDCRECDEGVTLPWAKVREGLENSQLSIDCPNCHSQYPFVYKQVKRHTLSITFHEPTSQDAEYLEGTPTSKTARVDEPQQKQVNVTSPGGNYDSSILSSK